MASFSVKTHFHQLYPNSYIKSHKIVFPGSTHPNLQVDTPLSNGFTESQTVKIKIITPSAKVAKCLQTKGLNFHFQSGYHRMHN